MNRKQFYKILGVIGLVSWSGWVHAACTTPPTCAELGYTKSAADCSGHTFLKCPFDQGVGYCDSGAGNGVLKTYNVGDSYIVNGVAVGIIVSLDSSNQHGTVVVRGGVANFADANAYCTAKKTADLSWSLAKGSDICDETGKNHGLVDNSDNFKCNDIAGSCECYLGRPSHNSYDGVYAYFCSAPF